jgi:hypothetical protein
VPAKHKKVALIILERGWRINGCYIGLGVSGGSAEVARGSRGCHVGKQKRPKFDHDA